MKVKLLLATMLVASLAVQAQNFGSMVNQAKRQASRKAQNEVNRTVGRAATGTFSFTGSKTIEFKALPTGLQELKALPEAKLDDPYKTAALCMAILCNYENNADSTFAMLDYLCRPNSQGDEKSLATMHGFIAQRLRDGKGYKAFAFFEGATVENNYTPKQPYKIKVNANNTSFQEKGRARLMLKSAGADSPGPIWLRQNKSGKWYVTQISCLTDVRLPGNQDEWK